MAKKISESDIRRQLSERHSRDSRGRFLPLKPEQLLSSIRTARDASRVAPATSNPKPVENELPPGGAYANEIPSIGMADAAKSEKSDPLMVSASTLIKEAKKLSIDIEFADTEEAKKIYSRIQVIQKLSKKSSNSTKTLQKLEEVIKPIEKELKRKVSFGAFLKEKIQNFKETLPEKIASKIPIVGGLVSEFLREKRTSKRQSEDYERDLIKRDNTTRATPYRNYDSSEQKNVNEESNSLENRENQFETSKATAFPTKTLEAIYREVVAIRKAVTSGGISGVPRNQNSLLNPGSMTDFMGIGRKSKLGRTFRKGRIIGKRIMRSLQKTRVGKLLGRTSNYVKGVGGKALGAVKNVGGKALGAVKNVGGKALGAVKNVGGKALGAVKNVGSTITQSGGGFFSKALGAVKNVGGKALGAVKNVGGKALGAASDTLGKLNPLNAIGSYVKSNAGKVIKSVVSIPGLGAIISGALAINDIMGIKADPELSPEEKKDKIGRTIVGAVGSGLGSVLLGAAGTALFPGIGTLIGTMGGMWVGEKLAGLLADAVGGKGIYDMVASIPGVGSLISVDENTKEKDKPKQPNEAGGYNTTLNVASSGGQTNSMQKTVNNLNSPATGIISSPISSNTTVGKMTNQFAAEENALKEAQYAANTEANSASTTVNNSPVNTQVNSYTNNFNDDIRIRNNESTFKTMKMNAMLFT